MWIRALTGALSGGVRDPVVQLACLIMPVLCRNTCCNIEHYYWVVLF